MMRTLNYILRRLLYLLLAALVLLAVVLLIVLFKPLWRNVFIYPELDREIEMLNSHRRPTTFVHELNVYRGIMHAHSFWSHDSEGTLHDLIPAAKNNGIEFIFLTDHPRGNIDSFPRGYKGYYDGVLIEPGSEKQGFAAWPLSDTVIDWKEDQDTISKNIVSSGGMLFYAHTEEPHNWGNPWYQGMEIYNTHTDTKDEKLFPHIINFLVNGKKYRHLAFRELFDEQASILARWDSLNMHRKIVGFSAADTHENQNIRARKLENGSIQWVGPNAKPIDTVSVNFRNRWLFREPDANGWVFRLMMDTYNEGFNYITNYVLADTLSVSSLSQHILKGHLFIAFKSLGDAKGFMYWAQDASDAISGIMGDSVSIGNARSLHAVSPLPGQFRLIHNGKVADISPEDAYEYSWSGIGEPGVYRLEVYIRLRNRFIPWIYTNPVYIY